MFNDLKDERVLVTGSTQGIAAAQAFVRAGARVGLNGRTPAARMETTLQTLRQEGASVEFFPGDLSKSEVCANVADDFVAHIGGVDVLINNAGGLVGRTPIAEIDGAFYDAVMNLNTRSAMMMARFALPYLKVAAQQSRQTNSVILVGSIAGHIGSGPGAALYGAAKAWLHTSRRTG